MIHTLDLLGVFAFAFFGANAAFKCRLNLLGVALCAFLSALGGGTIRELLLSNSPFYFNNYSYAVVIALAILCAGFLRSSRKAQQVMAVPDALGTIIFAYLGAHAATKADLGIVEHASFALLTAFGGGILCDIVIQQRPHAFRGTQHLVVPIGLSLVVWLVKITDPLFLISLLAVSFVAQMFITHLHERRRMNILNEAKILSQLRTVRQRVLGALR